MTTAMIVAKRFVKYQLLTNFPKTRENTKCTPKAIAPMTAAEIAAKLAGNTCGVKDTSCADQLAKAVLQADAALGK